VRTKYIFPLLLLLLPYFLSGKDRSQISDLVLNNLAVKSYAIDTEASAVVLEEKTQIFLTIENNSYTERETVHRVIKILKADAFDVANVKLYYPIEDYRNYIHEIKATTYNITGNDTIVTPFNNKDLLKKKIRKDYYELSFSLPVVKEGSVIEYSYEKVTQFYSQLYSWHMQGKYPKLYSEYSLEHSDKIEFTSVSHVVAVEREFKNEDAARASADSFCHTGSTGFFGRKDFWIRRYLAGVRKEPYVMNPDVYMERLDLQMTGWLSGGKVEHFSNSWDKVNEELWKKGGISKVVNGKYSFMDYVVDSLTKNDTSVSAKTKSIFNYVRTHIKCNDEKGSFSKSLIGRVFDDKEGNVFEN
jgi:Domain of Unknown Function with PDB structure (DUF3857)